MYEIWLLKVREFVVYFICRMGYRIASFYLYSPSRLALSLVLSHVLMGTVGRTHSTPQPTPALHNVSASPPPNHPGSLVTNTSPCDSVLTSTCTCVRTGRTVKYEQGKPLIHAQTIPFYILSIVIVPTKLTETDNLFSLSHFFLKS